MKKIKEKKKKRVFVWSGLIIALSVCVYCSFPNKIQNEDLPVVPENQEQITEDAEDAMPDLEEMIEAFFKERPVRDVPKNADLSSFLQGTFAKRHQDFGQMAGMYEKVLLSDPENQDIASSLFLYFALAGDIQKSELYAPKALEKNKDEAFPRIILITDLIEKEKYDEAIAELDALTPNYKTFVVPVVKAWIMVAQGKLDAGLDLLAQIKAQNLEALYQLHKGAMLDYFGKKEQAALAYNALLETSDYNNLRVLLILREFEDRTHLLANKQKLQEVYTAVENDSFISKEMMSQNNGSERVRSAKAGVAWALFDVASALVANSDTKGALFFGQIAHHLHPNSSVIHLFVGELLESMNILPQANQLYASVKPNQNIYLSANVRIVLNLIKMQQFDKAQSVMLALTEKYPKLPLFHMTLGDINRERKELELALKNYQQALKLVSSEDKQTAPLYFYQGLCHEELGHKDTAVALFEKALQLDPENPIYLNYVGYTWLEENKNVQEALKLIEKAVSYSPNDGNLLDSLGRAYFLLHDYDKALTLLEQAVSLESGNAVINSHLGDVYWKLKRYREARFQWSHAKTLKQASSEKLLTELSDKMANGLPK